LFSILLTTKRKTSPTHSEIVTVIKEEEDYVVGVLDDADLALEPNPEGPGSPFSTLSQVIQRLRL
jgi:hypothetical protein